MKITDPDVIKDGEKDLFEAIKEDLDLNRIREILKEKVAPDALESEGGSIVVHENRIAFKLDFRLVLRGSLMFDREGNYIPEGDETVPEAPRSAETDPAASAPAADGSASDSPETGETAADTGEKEVSSGEPESGGVDLEDLEADLDSDASSIDDDIDDILKESREFWEQKKE